MPLSARSSSRGIPQQQRVMSLSARSSSRVHPSVHAAAAAAAAAAGLHREARNELLKADLSLLVRIEFVEHRGHYIIISLAHLYPTRSLSLVTCCCSGGARAARVRVRAGEPTKCHYLSRWARSGLHTAGCGTTHPHALDSLVELCQVQVGVLISVKLLPELDTQRVQLGHPKVRLYQSIRSITLPDSFAPCRRVPSKKLATLGLRSSAVRSTRARGASTYIE